ncbi:MAG TPA: 16S rRNA (uracil(1498)-N(3))-methyltransferase [Gammaproteobacteria bacterium]|jgi:16S rRNA (uracil1498-N3)-methyltransferase
MSLTPRVYLAIPLSAGNCVTLDQQARHHIVNVLRLKTGADLLVFNGQGGEFKAKLVISGKQAAVELLDFCEVNRESGLHLHLIQAVSRGDRMDLTIQKAVELGVNRITPVFSLRSVSKLDTDRLEKRTRHWQSVLTSACEQSGRCILPVLEHPIPLDRWLNVTTDEPNRYILDPEANQSINVIPQKLADLKLVVGPEGGFDRQELEYAEATNCMRIRFGPRILRTETAAIAALAALQSRHGDLFL